MQYKANWNYPTAIKFGAGRISELPALCKELGISKPLIVTDPGFAKLPPLQNIQSILKAGGISSELFTDMKPNPVGRDVESGVNLYKAQSRDGVIALGGGSALDVGKAIALMVGQSHSLWDFEDVGDNWLKVNPKGIAPCIAIPTTAGTGSEVGRASVIVEEKEHRKVIIFHPGMLPPRVLADPELAFGLPPSLTAATGVDAFVHCFEAFCSPFYHPLAEGVGLQGMKLIHDHLPTAFRDGSNLEARSNMLTASIMGATAFQKGLGGVHALAHPIGAIFDTHHGLTNAVLLPYVVRKNENVIQEKCEAIGRYLNLKKGGFSGFLDWVLQFREDLNIPHTLKDLKIDTSRAEEIAKMAKADPSDGGNPKELSMDDYREIFVNALEGRL
jgi:alcohol dehydrogenase class IV